MVSKAPLDYLLQIRIYPYYGCGTKLAIGINFSYSPKVFKVAVF